MEFKKNWGEIIRNKFGVGNDIVITNIGGDIDFCMKIYPRKSEWYYGTKELMLSIVNYEMGAGVSNRKGWYKEHENNTFFNIVAYLTKEEFLDLVEEGRDVHIESKLTNTTIKDIHNNDYIQYSFDENYTNVKIGQKTGQAKRFGIDENNDLTGLVVALMDAFGKSGNDKIKVSDILLGTEVEKRDEYIELTGSNYKHYKEELREYVGKEVEYKLFEYSKDWKIGYYSGLLITTPNNFPFVIYKNQMDGNCTTAVKIRIKKQ